jgi:hypothetical protein
MEIPGFFVEMLAAGIAGGVILGSMISIFNSWGA